ncbi:phytoene desaturase family protein [Bacillus sp. FJAT-45037]|uniref:phytoene desaturase family protein n=1 Tax=Bacillus sp. FJAT-45037 TaxID=2011007 RepID=UPI000C24A896|nr:phytoene desaturase family protein [Bacillus sp. FJAT-45037]
MNKKVVIIGGGLAGMSTAIRLAARDYQVTIVEKGERLGGKLNIRKGNGFTFDTGPSILTMPWVLETLFESVGRNIHDYLTIRRVEPGWRTFFQDGTTIDLTSDIPKMLEQIKELSEKDATLFFPYLQHCQNMYKLSMKSFYKRSINGLPDMRNEHRLSELLQMAPTKTFDQTTKRYFSNKHLQQLFNFLTMYIGSSPYQAPAILSQMSHIQLGIGVFYVEGGMYKIAEAMEKVLNELGVTIMCNQKVTSVLLSGNSVQGVQLENDLAIHSDLVVSNLEAIPFYETMVSDKKKRDHAVHSLKKFSPTVSGLVLLLGINRTYDQLAHHNFFFSENQEKEFHELFEAHSLSEDPTIYVGISAKTDPTQAPKGKENLFILTHVPPLKKGETWNHNKEKYRELILAKLERMGLTELRSHIEYEYTFTPEDIGELYGSNGGSIYGTVTDRKRNGGFKIPNKSHEYENLYFVGGSTHPGGGVPMVTLSGHLTANLIIEHESNVFNDENDGQILA